MENLNSKIKAEYAKTIKAKSSLEVYEKIKASQKKYSKLNYPLLNLFPNIIQNLINLTRDSKFAVKEAKSMKDVNSFNLLLNSSKIIWLINS